MITHVLCTQSRRFYADKRIAYPVTALAQYTLWLPSSRLPTSESYTDMTPRRRFPRSIVDPSVTVGRRQRPPTRESGNSARKPMWLPAWPRPQLVSR